MILVVFHLQGATSFGLVDGELHRVGDLVGVHDYGAVDITRGASNCLSKRTMTAQKTFLVGIKNSHQAHFRQVETLAKEVDAHEHVVVAGTQVVENLDAVDGVDVGVNVSR